jgi:hypothetical protein
MTANGIRPDFSAQARHERAQARLVATQELVNRLTRRPRPAAWSRVSAIVGSDLAERLRRDLCVWQSEARGAAPGLSDWL